MSKEQWGPPTWKSMHEISIGYSNYPTDQEKYDMQLYFEMVSRILPCKECRCHFRDILQKYPPNVNNSCTLQTWLFNVHNEVNKRLGKSVFSIDQYQNLYGTSIAVHNERKLLGL